MNGKLAKLEVKVLIVLVVAVFFVAGVVSNISGEVVNGSLAGVEEQPDLNQIDGKDIGDIVNDTINKFSDISEDARKFLVSFVSKEQITEDKITNMQKIDMQNPPVDVKLGNDLLESNVGIYQIDYDMEAEGVNESKKIYVVTYSADEFKVPLELVPATAIEYLNFGETSLISSSTYLNTATDVMTSANNGYVMIDSGSITGMSTNLKITKSVKDGMVYLIVYKNGEDTGLRNIILADSIGTKSDFDKQSKNVVTFQPGDLISVYVAVQGEIEFTDIINLVKIEVQE